MFGIVGCPLGAADGACFEVTKGVGHVDRPAAPRPMTVLIISIGVFEDDLNYLGVELRKEPVLMRILLLFTANRSRIGRRNALEVGYDDFVRLEFGCGGTVDDNVTGG